MIHFLIGFLIFLVVVTILIIGFQYLIGLTGWTVPQPLKVILMLILFLICLIVFLNYASAMLPVGGPSGRWW